MLLLILEVQSSQIRGSLVEHDDAGAPHIYFSERLAVDYKPSAPTSHHIALTHKTLKEMTDMSLRVLHALVSEKTLPSGTKIAEVHYVLSSPWIVSQARTVSMNFKSPTEVSPGRVHDILESERNKLKPEEVGAAEMIEEKIFDVRLNGYSIADWHGRRCNDLQISYAVSVGSRESVNVMRQEAKKIVGEKKVHFHSSLLLQYIALRYDLEPDRESYMLVHAHGELTDVIVVRNGLCAFFGSFPIGINSIARRIAHAAKIDMKTADSLLALYLGGKLDDNHAEETGTIITQMTEVWSGELGRILRSGDLKEWLPDTVFILARSHEDFFTKAVKSVAPKMNTVNLNVDMVGIYALAIHRMEKQ